MLKYLSSLLVWLTESHKNFVIENCLLLLKEIFHFFSFYSDLKLYFFSFI